MLRKHSPCEFKLFRMWWECVTCPPRQGQEKFRIHLSFSYASPYPFLPPNHAFLPCYRFQGWLLPSLPAYTCFHPSLSATSLHIWWIRGWVMTRTRCMSPPLTWGRLSEVDLSQGWISALQQWTSSKPEGNRNCFSPYLGAALSCLKPFTRGWQVLENLLLNTC